ncbi:MAG: TIM-barrel domain-containing protein, partial [Candidatus Sumerlaeota bacterium]
LLSRDGWALVDDSDGIMLESREEGPFPRWVAPREAKTRRDWYFLGYGHDYKQALGDASKIFGRPPLPPRWALGYWWSRYWAYTDRELREMVDAFDRAGVPLDVMVIDMDWHLPGWTGYTWDERYFPHPKRFLKNMHERGLRVTLNLHPADGVAKHEAAFEDMARDLELDPEKIDRIPFDCTDPKFMDAYFRRLHHPHEEEGVDFWWMDWQQGQSSNMEGLDPLPWLNHLHWDDMALRTPERRPLIFSRYGGVGSGRYPVGFSGDTHSTWEGLEMQPEFTAMASNVLYGYWSHDIGGHATVVDEELDPELYLRWIQFGVYSPILRTHTTKHPLAERRVMAFPSPYDQFMIDAIRHRYEIAPYIYTENRKGMDTGLSLCRPLYYEWPDEAESYKHGNQYLFGDEMMVAPIIVPADGKHEMSPETVWLPPGQWFDVALGKMEKGGQTITRHYLRREIPVFVRPGTILPGQKIRMRLEETSCSQLVITAFPGGDGRYDYYEDDGHSQAYLKGESVTVRLEQRQTKTGRSVKIHKAKGDFEGFQKKRYVEVRFPATCPPKQVKVGRENVEWREEPDGEGASWYYDAENASTVVQIQALDLTTDTTIRIVDDPKTVKKDADGLKGAMALLDSIRRHMTSGSRPHPLHEDERLGAELAQGGLRIERDPSVFTTAAKHIQKDSVRLEKVIKAMIKELSKKEFDTQLPLVYLEKAAAQAGILCKERL